MRIVRKVAKIIFFIIALLITLCVIYGAIICNPEFMFKYQVKYMNLELYSDEPIASNALTILEDAQSRLLRSDIYDRRDTYKIFICNDLNKFRLFSAFEFDQSGAVSFPYMSMNSFLRKSNIEKNRLIGPSGEEVDGNRTLAYFIAHEVTHCIAARKIGGIPFMGLPKWVREGYSEFIAEDSPADVPSYYYGDYLHVSSLLESREVSTENLLSGKIE